MLDCSSTIASNLQNPDTLASKRSAEIGRLADKAGKITTPSLIKGLIPRLEVVPRSTFSDLMQYQAR